MHTFIIPYAYLSQPSDAEDVGPKIYTMLRIHSLSRDYTLLGSFDDTLDSSLNGKSPCQR